MLKVVPRAWSCNFSVVDGAEATAQTVSLSWWGDRGEFRVKGAVYTARRARSSYLLESVAGALARAHRPRRLSGDLVISYAGRRYALRPTASESHEILLLDGEKPIASISPEGLFTRTAAVELPKELPVFMQVFIIWLAMTLWKQAGAEGRASTRRPRCKPLP